MQSLTVERSLVVVGATILVALIAGAPAMSRFVGQDYTATGIVIGLTLAVALGVTISWGSAA